MAKDCSSRTARCSSCLRCGRRPCSVWQGPRSIARLGRTVLTYRGCARWSAVAAVTAAGLLIGGGLADVLLPAGSAAAVVALVWTAFTLRVIRLAPACPGPGGGPGPGEAGVREPRRPGPCPRRAGPSLCRCPRIRPAAPRRSPDASALPSSRRRR
ncbi:hypothetical protein GCM10018771_19080 [Streptomyces cellulosae]|nr:hypothetical protein GCM10018771_19080 [Streptomyces cellulosae]